MSSAFLPVVADEIWHQYPDYRALSVTVRGLQVPARAVFDGGPPAPPTWMESHIEAWRTAFRQFGANPRKTPCSVEALCLREIAFRQCLVDHGDAGSGTIIRRAEIAPGCDRHPQQLKIARGHRSQRHCNPIARLQRRRLSFDIDVARPTVAG